MTYLVNRRQVTIEWGHCDPAGIVFNSRFFELADWSTALLFQVALGITKPEMRAKYDADMPLVDVRARFMKPLKLADVVEIASTISEFRRSSFDITHQFYNQDELTVEAQETRVWVGSNPEDPSKLKSKPIPGDVIECFKVA